MPPEDARDDLLDLRFVGPATADVLAAANVDAAAIESKSVSHAQLVDLGVNPGVAARIRREHSLQWSFEGGEDLDRRAEQVRGLQDDEREWVAASYGDEASADGSGDATAEEAAWQAESTDATAAETGDAAGGGASDDDSPDGESAWREQSWPNGRVDDSFEREEQAWREQSTPTPVTELEGVGEADAKLLARAGVTSVRSLATAHVEHVADSLGVSEDRVAAWKDAARDHAQ
ncbi:MAG: helix-hairpin-helix domain-containing protein [Halobacterium sp.]